MITADSSLVIKIAWPNGQTQCVNSAVQWAKDFFKLELAASVMVDFDLTFAAQIIHSHCRYFGHRHFIPAVRLSTDWGPDHISVFKWFSVKLFVDKYDRLAVDIYWRRDLFVALVYRNAFQSAVCPSYQYGQCLHFDARLNKALVT